MTIRSEDNREGSEASLHTEPVEVLKRRSYARSLERAKLAADTLRWEIDIDSVGNILVTVGVAGLRLLRGEELSGVEFNYRVPSHGARMEDRARTLDDGSADRVRLHWRSADKRLYKLSEIPESRQGGNGWIEFRQPLVAGGSHLSYGYRHPLANCIAMTKWELDERFRVQQPPPSPYPAHESIFRYIGYPVQRLVVKLRMPDELRHVVPEARCLRHPNYPDYPKSEIEVVVPDPETFIVDEAVQPVEARNLKFLEAEGLWSLDVEKPLAGYVYELRWRVPNPLAPPIVRGETKQWQKLLLRLRSDGPSRHTTAVEDEAAKGFKSWAEDLRSVFQRGQEAGSLASLLMVYDEDKLALVPVLADPAVSGTQFEVPLGAGVSGAAFLRGDVVAWAELSDLETFIRPVRVPGIVARHILALPIFHMSLDGDVEHEVLETSPGAVVGVMLLVSDADGSGLAKCDEDTSLRHATQWAAQLFVRDLIIKLSGLDQDASEA